MDKGSIYVDDAGNPGADSGSDFLSSSRKSWTAVIVPSRVAGDIAGAMQIFLRGVRDDYGASELHFTDIYSGRGVWNDVDVAKRIQIFDLMTELLESFALPIVHQTISEETLSDHQSIFSDMAKAPSAWWDIKDVAHFGFLFLCSKVSRHILEMHKTGAKDFELPMPLIVDEGLAKAGTNVDLPNWGDVIEGPRAQFCRSKDTPGIQIADFAAFTISRSQWIMVQQKSGTEVKKGDLEFLKTTSRLNLLNLPLVKFSPEKLSKQAYEDLLAKDRREKGLPERPRPSPRKR